MNDSAAQPNGLPLEELQLTPQWVKAPAKSYEKHAGDGGDRRERRDGGGNQGFRNDRPRRPESGRAGPPPRRDERRRPPQDAPAHRPEPPAAPAPVDVTFLAEDAGLASMVVTMKQSPRAYALFDLAKLILNKPERHRVKIVHQPIADGTRPPLYFVAASETPFFTQTEAVRYVFRQHLELICRQEQKPIDPPKGNFTFINRCGITGEWLGPPNYHEYQARLVRHHQQRLRQIPFEEFRAKIQTVRDEAAVQAWLSSMSTKTEYVSILDAEPKAFESRDELEKHVLATHLDKLVTAIHELVISGPASRRIEHRGILTAVRDTWETESRFPLKTVNELRPRLQHEGFYFFKHPNGITYISHARLKRFDLGTTLTGEVQQILSILRSAKKGVTIKELLGKMLPPAPAAVTPVAVDPAATSTPTVQAGLEERILADLRWLLSDGYIIEFSDGRLWAPTEKVPPPPAPAKADPAPAAAPVVEEAKPDGAPVA